MVFEVRSTQSARDEQRSFAGRYEHLVRCVNGEWRIALKKVCLINRDLPIHGEALEDHLGKARQYLDLALDESPHGEIEARAGVQRYAYPANWKFQIENWTDHSHARHVHESAFSIPSRRGMGPAARSAADEDPTGPWHGVTTFGHGCNTERTREVPRGAPRDPAYVGHLERLRQRYGRERAEDLLSAEIQLMIFPNFFIQPRRHHFRVVRPIAVDRTEVYAYPYTLKGMPRETNERLVGEVAWWASAAGFGQPDDLEMFVRVQEGLQVRSADWVLFMLGVEREEVLSDGEIRGIGENELTQRGIYREWKRLMS